MLLACAWSWALTRSRIARIEAEKLRAIDLGTAQIRVALHIRDERVHEPLALEDLIGPGRDQ